MSKRELIQRLIAGENVERCGFWLGMPHGETWTNLHRYFGTSSELELREKLGDDLRWITPEFHPSTYRAPDGRGMFDISPDRSVSTPPLANCESVEELEQFVWPNPDYVDFSATLCELREAGDVYRMSGFWTPYFHRLSDFFGMEEYFVKMLTQPEVVHAATNKICEFYYEVNERYLEAARDSMDAFFFGNDFGTQLSLLCAPAQFEEFILPWFGRFTELGHSHGRQVILHSCGSIYPVIERLIELGVDCLHPLQAKASNMNAERLAAEFKGRIAFMGGIDAQGLMTEGTPEQIRADVRRVKRLLGPNLIVSPSHEAILPNVPPENVEALALAAFEEE